jgi:hypothetical protein
MAKALVKRGKDKIEEMRMQGLTIKKPIKKREVDKDGGLGNDGMPGRYKAGVFTLNKNSGLGSRGNGGKKAGAGKKNKPQKEIRVPGM